MRNVPATQPLWTGDLINALEDARRTIDHLQQRVQDLETRSGGYGSSAPGSLTEVLRQSIGRLRQSLGGR